MQVKLSSNNYDIIANGRVFLFEQNKDLTIEVVTEDLSFSLSLYFLTDETKKQTIEKDISENKIVFKCYNFLDTGTGLKAPVEIAQINGKKLYLMFWSYVEGTEDPKSRSVQYTIYYEKEINGGKNE